MHDLPAAFRIAKNTGHPAIIGYLPTGYPEPGIYCDMVKAATSGGLSVMELGLPVDQPILDGQIIQKALKTIRKHGVDVDRGLELGAEAIKYAGCAGVAMLYAETLDAYGPEHLLARCRDLEIAGILPVGMQVHRWLSFADMALQYDISVVGFIEWTFDEASIQAILKKTTGYVYAQSSNGATGRKLSFNDSIIDRLTYIKRLVEPYNLPVAVGFGIRSPSDVAELNQLGIDGVVIGTALVESAAQGTEHVGELISSMCAATKQELN
jgi:tryptophan synthase alpha chain